MTCTPTYVSVQQESVLVHDVFAQHHGQEFIISEVLDVSRDNVTRFLLIRFQLVSFWK